MPDYTKLAATASRLVSNAGRTITLVKFDRTASNASKPWLGASDPRGTATELEVKGVFVEPSSATRLGMSTEVNDLLKRSEQIILVASTADLQDYNEVKDSDNTRWIITGMETLKPAETSLLYFIGVKR